MRTLLTVRYLLTRIAAPESYRRHIDVHRCRTGSEAYRFLFKCVEFVSVDSLMRRHIRRHCFRLDRVVDGLEIYFRTIRVGGLVVAVASLVA